MIARGSLTFVIFFLLQQAYFYSKQTFNYDES